MRKEVAIEPYIIGKPSAPYKVKEIKVFPNVVFVKGPENIVANIASVKLSPININDTFSDIKAEVPLLPIKDVIFESAQDVKIETVKVEIYLEKQE